LPPRNFHKRMYLLGAATSYIIFPPRKYQLVAALPQSQNVHKLPSGESRIIFLPEQSSIYQYRPEISAIIVKKQSRTRLHFAHPLLYILKTQKMYCAF